MTLTIAAQVSVEQGGQQESGWDILILEVGVTVTSALTLTFTAPHLKPITINLCKLRRIHNLLLKILLIFLVLQGPLVGL